MFQSALFDAVPAVLLGLVKRLVGTFDSGVAPFSGAKSRQANGHGDGDSLTLEVEGA